MYLIEILHQTTTFTLVVVILGKLYLIEILHQTTTCGKCEDCLRRCILSKFYIKPQRCEHSYCVLLGCILSKFYIKPQQPFTLIKIRGVVSYRNSTSNHNGSRILVLFPQLYLIEILHQTTTAGIAQPATFELYLIEILHQTTTVRHALYPRPQLYLIEILHQTTTEPSDFDKGEKLYLIEILHQTTTRQPSSNDRKPLYLIEILHQTTTYPASTQLLLSCILSKFYIKPQRGTCSLTTSVVVSYRNSTSNHNAGNGYPVAGLVVSYRNSTSNHNFDPLPLGAVALYLIEILHQTTTTRPLGGRVLCCILSKFYIKPQLAVASYPSS